MLPTSHCVLKTTAASDELEYLVWSTVSMVRVRAHPPAGHTERSGMTTVNGFEWTSF